MAKQDRKKALNNLAGMLDQESWQWLLEQHPRIADALENAVINGATMNEIRVIAWSRTGRKEIVTRIENAARWLMSLEE